MPWRIRISTRTRSHMSNSRSPEQTAGDPAKTPSPAESSPSSSSSRSKLIKIPPFPIRRNPRTENEETEDEAEEEDEDEDDEEDDGDGDGDGDEDKESNESSFSMPSSFRLNRIRTHSIRSPLRFSSSADEPSKIVDDSNNKAKCTADHSPKLAPMEQGIPHFRFILFYFYFNMILILSLTRYW